MAAWRDMDRVDLGAVSAIADALHPDHPERPVVFAERLTLAPRGCFVLADGSGRVCGFAITHPWRGAAPPPLDTLIGTLPAMPDRWYIHDVALLAAARGQGHLARLLGLVAGRAAAAGLDRFGLVAVGGTDRLWRRHGFRSAGAAAGGPALESYGPGAVAMEAMGSRLCYIT